MPGNAGAPRVIRFGVFEVDLRAGELRKSGLKVRLQEQPFQVLAMLLEHPGEVVTRDELQKTLWSTDTFVDFEHGVNTAISKIREALGDSAESPRFVETLPRRGYRFIAIVPPVCDRRPEDAARRAALQRRIALAAIMVLAVALGVASWFWFRGSRPTPPEVPLAAVPLTAYPGIEQCPSFSPDGTQVAFSWNGEKEDNYDIYVKLIGVESPLRLTRNPAKDFSPAWSPDGRWIAFVRGSTGGKFAVVLTSPIPGPERVLTETRGNLGMNTRALAWSPDSRWLAMVGADKPAEIGALFLYSIETGERRRLTSPPANTSWDSCPAFSPDARTLAFVRCVAYWNSDVYLLDLSPGLEPIAQPRQVTNGNWRGAGPAWTTDGRSLIFSVWSAGGTNLWRVAASGASKPQRLTTIGAEGAYPAISRRGNRLAYAQTIVDVNIWRIEFPTPGGKATSQKFVSSTRNEEQPQFSPDGKKVAFQSDRSGTDEIWVCDADGSNVIQITSLGGPTIGVGPRWSPDSRRLTFTTNIEGHSEVYVVNASGGNPRRMTSTPTYSNNPSWSSDGRWILFDSATPKRGIYRVPAEGGPAVLLADKKGWAPIESPDGKLIYCIGDAVNRIHLLRSPVEGGEAEQVLDSLSFAQSLVVVNDGVYFIPPPDPESGASIQFLNTTTGRIRRIASIGKVVGAGLTVSPDRRWILYTQVDQAGSDLMLVENFR